MKITDTPETNQLIRTQLARVGITGTALASKLTFKCEELERERNELREKYAMHHAEAERLTQVIRAGSITKDEWVALRKEWFSCKYAEMQPADAVRARCSDDSDRIKQLESALAPSMWTLEMSEAWYKNLPDLHAAFAAISALANASRLASADPETPNQ